MPLATNPFHVRTSEQAGSDTRFLGLFGPGVLQGVAADQLWDRLIVLRSAPGGGKTSMIRLLTPGVLRALHENRQREDARRLAETLTDWGVLDDSGPTLLGARLNCDLQYASLRDIASDEESRRGLFYALVNARVLLATLRGAVVLGGGEWPADVERVRVDALAEINPGAAAAFPIHSGGGLFRAACDVERRICARLNDLEGTPPSPELLHTDLWALYILAGEISYDGKRLVKRTLVAFDDVQTLHHAQRDDLRRALMNRELGVSRWIAERWHGLSTEETFEQGAQDRRDYAIIQLDGWADDAKITRFERTVADIANRRSHASDVIQQQALTTSAFESFLQDVSDVPLPSLTLEKMTSEVRARVHSLAGESQRYRTWLAEHGPKEVTLDALIKWRELEILIHRDKGRSQRDLFPDEELSGDEYKERFSSSVTAAAELFLAKEYRLPYYHGMRRLALLASWNIEQFLDLAGDVFDLAVMAVTLKKSGRISPRQQHEIARKAARRLLDAIPRRMSRGDLVRSLLDRIGEMSVTETFRPTAPYAPGVNAFAISMADLRHLTSPTAKRDASSELLREVLTTSVWNNLLQVKTEYPCKGKLWAVFYLNRLLCAHYNLPLSYGGFREKRLTEVKSWLTAQHAPLQLGLTTAHNAGETANQ